MKKASSSFCFNLQIKEKIVTSQQHLDILNLKVNTAYILLKISEGSTKMKAILNKFFKEHFLNTLI